MDFGDSDRGKRKSSRHSSPRWGSGIGAVADEWSGDPVTSEADQIAHGDPFADEISAAPVQGRRRDRRKSRSGPFEAKDPFSAPAHEDPFAEARARNQEQYMAQSNQPGPSSLGTSSFGVLPFQPFQPQADTGAWNLEVRDTDGMASPFGGALNASVPSSSGGSSKPPKYPFGSSARSSGNSFGSAAEGNKLAPRSQFVSPGDPFKSDEQEEYEHDRLSEHEGEGKNPARDWSQSQGRVKFRGDQVFIRSVPVSLFSKQALSQHFTRLPVTVWDISLRGTKHPDSRRTAVVTFGSEQEALLAIEKGRTYNQTSLDLSIFKPFGLREKENTAKRRELAEPTSQLVFAFVPEELASEKHIRNLFNSISDYGVTQVSLKERPYRDTVKRTSIITFKNVDAATAAYRNLPLYNNEKLVVSYRQKQTKADSAAKTKDDTRDKETKPSSSSRKEDRGRAGSSSQTPRTEEERLKEIERLRKEIALIEEKKRQMKARNAIRFGQKPRQSSSQNETPEESRKPFVNDRQKDNEMEVQKSGTQKFSMLSSKTPERTSKDSQWRKGRKMDIQDAKQLIGTCQEMCPLDEFESRIAQRDVSLFELKQGPGSEPDLTKAVKKYRRSAAISEEQKPEEVRPPPVLARTMDHLKKVCDSKHSKFYEIHNFVRDRTRSIRQDFTLQGIRDECCVRIHEESVRFHIMSEHRLCGTSSALFSSKQNLEQLDKCLISLRETYDLRRQNNLETSQNEAEMQAYYILTQMSNPQTCVQLWKGFAKDVRRSAPVRFALEVVLSVSDQFPNSAKFFACVRTAPYLMACLMHSRFGHMRVLALQSLNFTHGNAASRDEVPVSTITKSLGFEDEDEALRFFGKMGVEVISTVRDDGVQQVITLPSSEFDPDQLSSWKTVRADKNIEGKAEHLKPSEIISGASSAGFETAFRSCRFRKVPQATFSNDKKSLKTNVKEAPVSKEGAGPFVGKQSTGFQTLRPALLRRLRLPDQAQPLRSNVDALDKTVPAFVGAAHPEMEKESPAQKTLGNRGAAPTILKPQGHTPTLSFKEAVSEKRVESGPKNTSTMIFGNAIATPSSASPSTASTSTFVHKKNVGAPNLPHIVPRDTGIPSLQTKSSILNKSGQTSKPDSLLGKPSDSHSATEEIRSSTQNESRREKSEDDEQKKLREQASKVAEERQRIISIAQKAREVRYKERCERLMLEFKERSEAIGQCMRIASDAIKSLDETRKPSRTETLGHCSHGLESLRRVSILIRAADRFLDEAQRWPWEGQPFPRGPLQALFRFRENGNALWTAIDRHRLKALDRSPEPAEEESDSSNADRRYSTVWSNPKSQLQGFIKAVTDRIPIRALSSGKPVPHSGKEIDGVFNAMKKRGLVRWQGVLLGSDKETSPSSSVGMAWLRSRLEREPGTGSDVINHRNLEKVAYPCMSVLHLSNHLRIPSSSSTIIWAADGSDYDSAFLRDLNAIEQALKHLRAQSEKSSTGPPFLIVVCFNCNGPISTRVRQETQGEENNEWIASLVGHGLVRAVRIVMLSRETVIQQSEDQSFSRFLQESVTSKVNTELRSTSRLSRLDDRLLKVGNQAWMKALHDQLTRSHWNDSDALPSIIRHINHAWQTVAGTIEDEKQNWPTEFSHHREHFANMKTEVSKRMRLPLPPQTDESDLREYLRVLCDMAGITTPKLSDKKGFQAYAEFCHALSSVMLPVVVCLLDELHHEVIPLPGIDHDPQTAMRVSQLNILFASILGQQPKPLSRQDRSGYEGTLGKRRRGHGEDENRSHHTQATDMSGLPRRLSLEDEYPDRQATPKRRRSLPWAIYGRRKLDEVYEAVIAESEAFGQEIDAAIEILRKRRRLIYHSPSAVVSS